ncbi:hypothetical protein GCM10008961_30900 [Deinococcus knuensis]|uniref:Type I restriction modification DNA specificity domain-containing protein n=2 Tax=Deinococcus knuensis TaxID=1837380 RepID=A0ABQ2SSY0_9DEIO|nr:hypothetical protein GCM10008961_30900 [Deinococcus knuensis]
MLQNYFADNAKGTAQKGIYLKALSQTPIPLPPLAEQVRISDKLDALLARVEAGRERLERVPKLLKRFRQSVLSAAVSGELTREWREEEDASWTAPAPLSQFTELDVGYAFKSADFSTSGVRLLRGDNIEPGRLRWREAKCMPPEKLKDFEGYTIRPGDVILAMDRPIISSGLKIARATEQDVPSMLVQRVCRFKPKPDLDPGFLFVLLRGHNFITYLGDKQNGTQVPHISAKQILGFAVSVPDLNEQAEIVRRVESLFSIADRIEAKYAAALSSFDRLTPALLAKAFRGELVPQDPNDEPASVLLDRIRAAREAEGGKRGRGRPAKAAAGSGDGAEVKRRGRPPGANAQAGAEGAEPKRRGRPPKVREAVSEPDAQPAAVPEAVEASAAPRGRGRPPGAGIPQASSFEDALRRLEEQKLVRTQGTRQVGLFGDTED